MWQAVDYNLPQGGGGVDKRIISLCKPAVQFYPYGNKHEGFKVAQIDIANEGMDAEGLTEYLYSVQEPKTLNGESIDVSGTVKFKRQASVMGFLRKFVSSIDSGRNPSEEELALVKEMRSK